MAWSTNPSDMGKYRPNHCRKMAGIYLGIAIFRPASGDWYFDYNLDGIVDKSFRYGG